MSNLREIDTGIRDSIETYQRTQATEEGRIISFSRALREYRSGVYRGICEYRGEPRPISNHTNPIMFGTKDILERNPNGTVTVVR